eukprot:PITA_28458
MIPVRKKNGDIRTCIDFRNLNKAIQKDNFPLPTMEQILHSVAGSELMSFLDDFSGYNQVLVHPDDRLKTTFRTKWGTYAYQKIPFGLINAGAIFQRVMDIAFKGLINKTVFVYLDNITVFSKRRSNHLHDLNQIFERCRRYGISLNPKKSFFALDQGKFLGFIVSKDGIYIDPDRIKEISEIPFPHNKKSMQSFLGQINFVKRFVPDFSHIILPLQTMIKKNLVFKWGTVEKEAFDLIKQSIINVPALNTPNFSNHFTLYTIASDLSYAAILTQINNHNLEAPISFFSSNFQGAELNYSEVEKQDFAVYKAIKHYRPFLLKAHTKVIVPFSALRQLLIQRELGASNIPKSGDTDHIEEINQISITNSESQYADLIFYLKNGHAPPNLSYKNKRVIRLKSKNSVIIDDVLFRQNYDSVLLRCLEKPEAQKVLQELHDGLAGGHFGADTTAHKIIHVGYYWPTLFIDTHGYVRKCQSCQLSSGRQRKPAFHLQPVNIDQPFEQWGLDIIGEITPQSSKQHKYILTANDYFTKWVEAIPLKTTNSEGIIEFIDQFIITRFGVPNALVFGNASYFSGNTMFEFAIKRGFKLKYSANYYPQGNGLAESTNKNLLKIIKRTIEQNHKNWHKSLVFALWADRITQKASIGTSPFNLVYGKEAVLLTNLALPSLALVQFIEERPSSSIQLRHDQILKLEEEREKAKITHDKHQQIIKLSFDLASSSSKQLQVGDLVLKWDKAHEDKGKHTKFQKMWLGPFHISEKVGHSTFILQDLSGKRDTLPVNGLILKKFFN